VKEEVYHYQRKIEYFLNRIECSSLDEDSKKKIVEFYRYLVTRGYSKGRITKYLYTLLVLGRLIKKPFSDLRREDIEELVRKIEERDDAEWTKRDNKVIFKLFYRWLKKAESYPDEVRWIKIPCMSMMRLPEELLTEEEVMKMVNIADHVRDKAFLLVLYESGCRIGELLTMQIKHVHFDSFGAVLHVDGKTGPRRVRVIMSAPKLNQWLENHPKHDNPDSALWITIGTNSRYKVWTYTTAKEVIKKIALRAGVRKRVYPHLFRHSRATYLANHLTEAQMKQYFGWTQSSEMASVYVHLSGRDVDNALLKLNGLESKVEEQKNGLGPIICPRCKAHNSPDAKFCSKCSYCFDIKTAVQIDEVRSKVDMLMNELVKNPDVLNALVEEVKRLKG